MSRQPSLNDGQQHQQQQPSPSSSAVGDSPVDNRGDISERPSSSSRNRVSEGSEGYPSWLPKRPLHPPPGSTIQSSSYMHGPPGPSNEQFVGGRKPTPRSVRIISLQDSADGGGERDRLARREPTDQTRVSHTPFHARVWSRATAPTMFDSSTPFFTPAPPPPPRFNSTGLRLELLRNPSPLFRLYFYLLPLLVFAHIPLQTFLDFNAVFILFQVAKFPSPQAPGVPGSGRNWALGAAAYVACWFTWVFVVFILYELIYSFTRRWRIKRPYILPIYFSSPAFNFAALSSYSVFCFLQHVRLAGFLGESGSLHDGLAETFWFYSQNLPTVALLLPRTGLSLALLFAFSAPQLAYEALADTGITPRDHTYFRSDGALTAYARGVLIANAAWTAWRLLVLISSWIGLWVLSGHSCAGLCGPRYRWEEEEAEKNVRGSIVNVSDEPNVTTTTATASRDSEVDALPWSWKECTRARVQDAYDFCMTVKPLKWSSTTRGAAVKQEPSDDLLGPSPASVLPFEGLEQVLAAVGLASSPPPARRGILTEDLFAAPMQGEPSSQAPGGSAVLGPVAGPSKVTPSTREFSDVIPKVVKRSSKERPISGPSAPLMSLPYPFTGRGAQVSSKDKVPFPPSPVPSGEKAEAKGIEVMEHEIGEEEIGEDEDDDEGDGAEGDIEAEEGEFEFSEEPSSGRASGSMSSLGRPVMSRYPFQFRRPAPRAVSPASSSPAPSRTSPHPQIAQTQARDSPSAHSGSNSTPSRASQSTGNRESTDSPRSFGGSGSGVGTSSGMPSPTSPVSQGSGIPMPPRHPQQRQRGRARAGTAPSAIQMSPESVVFPSGDGRRTHARTATETSMGESFGAYDTTMISYEDDSHYDDHGYEGQRQEEEEEGEGMMEQPEPEGPHEAAEREDIVGLLSRSAAPSPRSSLISLRLRGSHGLTPHRRGHHHTSSHSANGSRSNSHSGSSPSRSRSRTGSMSALARSRAQSLIQGIGAASRSSLDLVHAMRMRANSSMARLEEDVPPVPTTATPGSGSDGHSRSGSGSDAMTSSGSENYTFGHPLRMTQWPRDDAGRPEEEEAPVPQTIRVPASSQDSGSRSNLSVSSPSERPSERTVTRLPTPERTGGSGNGSLEGRVLQSDSTTSSQPDIEGTASSVEAREPEPA